MRDTVSGDLKAFKKSRGRSRELAFFAINFMGWHSSMLGFTKISGDMRQYESTTYLHIFSFFKVAVLPNLRAVHTVDCRGLEISMGTL